MNEKDQKLLSIGFGYLTGLIETGQVTFVDLDRFLRAMVEPPDCIETPESQSPLFEDGLIKVATAMAVQLGKVGASREVVALTSDIAFRLGLLAGSGNLTPMTLAALCKCGVSDFEEMLEEAEGNSG